MAIRDGGYYVTVALIVVGLAVAIFFLGALSALVGVWIALGPREPKSHPGCRGSAVVEAQIRDRVGVIK